MKFLVPNYSCLQNPWPLSDPRCLCPQLNLLNPPPTKFLGTPLVKHKCCTNMAVTFIHNHCHNCSLTCYLVGLNLWWIFMYLPHYNQSVHLSPSNSKRMHFTGHKTRFINFVQCSLQLDTRSASLTKPYQNSGEDKFPQAHNELNSNTQFTSSETYIFLSVAAAWSSSLYL